VVLEPVVLGHGYGPGPALEQAERALGEPVLRIAEGRAATEKGPCDIHRDAEPLLQRRVLLVVLELDPRRAGVQDLPRPGAVVLADAELHRGALLRGPEDGPAERVAVSRGRPLIGAVVSRERKI